jgi:hypothetical protein
LDRQEAGQMAIDPLQVHGLAEAIIEIIERMPAKEKSWDAPAAITVQVNELIALAKEVAPAVEARLCPTAKEDISYAEAEIAARKVLKLLPRPEPGHVRDVRGRP